MGGELGAVPTAAARYPSRDRAAEAEAEQRRSSGGGQFACCGSPQSRKPELEPELEPEPEPEPEPESSAALLEAAREELRAHAARKEANAAELARLKREKAERDDAVAPSAAGSSPRSALGPDTDWDARTKRMLTQLDDDVENSPALCWQGGIVVAVQSSSDDTGGALDVLARQPGESIDEYEARLAAMAEQVPHQQQPPPDDQERRQREAEQKWAQHLDTRRESCARLAELQAALKERGLDTEGKKVVLEQRLAEAKAAESGSAAMEPEPDDALSLLESLESLPSVPGQMPAGIAGDTGTPQAAGLDDDDLMQRLARMKQLCQD